MRLWVLALSTVNLVIGSVLCSGGKLEGVVNLAIAIWIPAVLRTPNDDE